MTLYFDQRPVVSSQKHHPANGVIRVTFADITLGLTLAEASWLAANLQREIRAFEMSDDQRRKLQAGDVVIVTDDHGVDAEYEVKYAPWQLGHGEWVIGLCGISGGYKLDRVSAFVRAAEEPNAVTAGSDSRSAGRDDPLPVLD